MSNAMPIKEKGGELNKAKSLITLPVTVRSATTLTNIRAQLELWRRRKKLPTTPARYKNTNRKSKHSAPS